MAQYRHLSDPDPEYAAALAQGPAVLPRPDLDTLRQSVRMVLDRRLAETTHLLPPNTEYSIQDNYLPVHGGQITLRCLTPTPAGAEDKTFPLLVWFHGGGLVVGSIDADDYFLRMRCVSLQICIVNVDYRLAPEHIFPIALNDSYTAVKWAAENAALLSASLSNGFLVGGSSSGGNLATVIAHKTLVDPFFSEKKITGQLLGYPVIVHPKAHPKKYESELLSLDTVSDVFPLTRDDLIFYCDMAKAPTDDPEFSPLLYSSHEGLSPVFFQVCGLDPLRDEDLLYEKLLREDGVPTRLYVYPGLPHGFADMFRYLSTADKYRREWDEGVKWLLNNTPV